MPGHDDGGCGSSYFHERYVDLAAFLQPLRHREVLRAHEFRIEQLRLVAIAGVAEDGDDGLARAKLFGKPDRAGDIDAGRATDADAFMFEQLVNDRYGFL